MELKCTVQHHILLRPCAPLCMRTFKRTSRITGARMCRFAPEFSLRTHAFSIGSCRFSLSITTDTHRTDNSTMQSLKPSDWEFISIFDARSLFEFYCGKRLQAFASFWTRNVRSPHGVLGSKPFRRQSRPVTSRPSICARISSPHLRPIGQLIGRTSLTTILAHHP